MNTPIRVTVDRGICLSSETCASKSELFGNSPDGLVYLKGPDGVLSEGPVDVGEASLAGVRSAEQSCPSGAITVTVGEADPR